MLIIRNSNVALSNLRKPHVALSNLRKPYVAMSILREYHVACCESLQRAVAVSILGVYTPYIGGAAITAKCRGKPP